VIFMKIRDFCKWITDFEDYCDEIVGLHTGHTLELKLVHPVIEYSHGVEIEQSESGTTFIPQEDEAIVEYYVPSILDFSKKYSFILIYKEPFWVILRRED